MVRGVVNDSDADCARNPDKPDSVHSIAGKLAVDHEYALHYRDRCLLAVLAVIRVFGICAIAAAFLVAAPGNVGLLRGSNAVG